MFILLHENEVLLRNEENNWEALNDILQMVAHKRVERINDKGIMQKM